MLQPEEDCFCHHCGYNLRGLSLEPESTCPECGKPVAEAIDPTRFVPIPNSPGWLALRRSMRWLLTAMIVPLWGPLLYVVFVTLILPRIRVDGRYRPAVALCLLAFWAVLDGLCTAVAAQYWIAATKIGAIRTYRGIRAYSLFMVSGVAMVLGVTVVEFTLFRRFWWEGSNHLLAVLALLWLMVRFAGLIQTNRWVRLLALDVGQVDLSHHAHRNVLLWTLTLGTLATAVLLIWTESLFRSRIPGFSGYGETVFAGIFTLGFVALVACLIDSSLLLHHFSKHLRNPQP